MKITNIKRNVMLLALLGGVAAGSLGFYFLNSKVAVADVSLAPTTLQAEYARGSVIDIPKGELSVGEDSFTVQPTVQTPDGRVGKLTQLSLDEIGEYVLEYSTFQDGKYYSATSSFCVYDYTYYNGTTNEPLSYQKATYTNINADDTTTEVEIEGLAFSIKPSEVVRSSQILNVKGLTKEDALISIEATPVVSGTPDARELYVRFTDVYDETNHITVIIRRAPDEGRIKDYSYCYASYGSQPYLGWSYDDPSSVFEYPQYTFGVRNGMKGEWEKGHVAIDIYYDDNEKAIYMPEASGSKEMLVSFAEDFAKPWKGFTTGEVYLSMWAEMYETVDNTKPYEGMITGLHGQDITAGLTEGENVPLYKVTETQAPSIDFGEYKTQENIPDGMVGHPYSVYDGYGSSIFVKETPSVKVYYGYYSSSRYVLPLKDGAFVPQHDGVHTIEYTAKDVFGNEAKKLVDVYVRKDAGKNFTLDVENYEDYQTGKAGETFYLPTLEAVTVSGNLGNAHVEVVAKHEDGTELPIEEFSFLPKKGGEWTIVYTATDAVQRTGVFSFTAQVSVDEGVVFMPVQNLNKYAIVGAKNPIPVLGVIDYNLGGAESVADKVYAKKGEQTVEITDGYFTPTEAGEYAIVYEATSSKNYTSQQTYTIIAVDVGFESEIAMDKYFYSEAIVDSETWDNDIRFSVTPNQPIEFIRPVNGEEFFFAFNLLAGTTASGVELRLTDINNPNQEVTLTFAKGVENVTLSINGGRLRQLKGFSFGGGADFPVSINHEQIIVDSNRAEIENYRNGEKFQGFDSQLVMLSVTVLSDSAQPVTLLVNEISEQRLNNITEDYISPTLVKSELMASRLFPGETIKLPKVKFIDVLDPYVTSSLSVYGPDGKIVKDANGRLMENVPTDVDYYLNPTAIGTYTVVYTYSDSVGNGGSQEGFRVISREKPTIEVSTEAVTAQVGKAITVRSATVQSVSDKVQLYIFVQRPSSSLKELARTEKGEYNMELTLEKAGRYLVRYLAIDEWNNTSIAEYFITVS